MQVHGQTLYRNLNLSTMAESEHEMWGWESLFKEIDLFVGESGR